MEITTGFIGVTTPNYPINAIYLFTSGQHEAVLGVALKPSAPPVTDGMKEAVYSLVQAHARTLSPTLDPDDPMSAHYEPRT